MRCVIPRLATLVAVASCATAAGAIVSVSPAAASGSTTSVSSTTSSNWAGYAVTGSSSTHFSKVLGSWKAPDVTCSGGSQTYSAFWVGIGGMSEKSNGLEQIGTEADCSQSGHAGYYAWYELLPAAPHNLAMKISPGDLIVARVHVNGNLVTLRIHDETSGAQFVKTATDSNIDVSSAEWVAEAPSACSGNSFCQPLPLSDFNTVDFTGASATANGHQGTISDPAWQATAIDLSGAGDDFGHHRFFMSQVSDTTATPSSLSPGANGEDTFSVTYSAASAPGSPSSPGSGSGGNGGGTTGTSGPTGATGSGSSGSGSSGSGSSGSGYPGYPGSGYPGGGYPGGGYPGGPPGYPGY